MTKVVNDGMESRVVDIGLSNRYVRRRDSIQKEGNLMQREGEVNKIASESRVVFQRSPATVNFY